MISCTKCCGLRKKERLQTKILNAKKQTAIPEDDVQYHPNEIDIFEAEAPDVTVAGKEQDEMIESRQLKVTDSTQKLQ